MLLDGVGEAVHAGVNSAEADTVAVGVGVEVGQGPGFAALAIVADGEAEVVEFAVLVGDHGVNSAEGVTAGGVFVGGDVAGVGQAAGADRAGRLVVVVGVVIVNGAVGNVALLFFDGHEAENGMGDLLLVELGLAGAVEIAGGLPKFLVGEVVEGFIDGNVAGAQSVTVEGAGDAGTEGGALVNVGLEGQPGVMLAGLGDFGVPLAGGRGGKGRHRKRWGGGASRTGQHSAPLRVESGGFEVGGGVGAVGHARVASAALDGELAAGVLPAFAGVVPMEAKLADGAADLLGRLRAERDPEPFADDFGQRQEFGETLTEHAQDFVGGEGPVSVPLLEVHIRKNPLGRFGLGSHNLRRGGCGFGALVSVFSASSTGLTRSPDSVFFFD